MANKLITLKDSSNNNLYPMTPYNAVTDANGNNLPSDFSQIGGNVQSDWNEADSSSGAYIKNKPTIPTVNNSTITVTQGGVSKGTFTLNQSSDATIALEAGSSDFTSTDIQILEVD